jgi:Domain of unknown function (DUF4389)
MNDNNPPADHVFVNDDKTGSPIEENLKSGTTWLRCLFMLISSVLFSVALFAGTVIVILGFFWVLITGEVKQQIKETGQSLATYLYGIARYLTFNTEEKPFPLGGEWPSGASEEK